MIDAKGVISEDRAPSASRGTRDIISTPPATNAEVCPQFTFIAASEIASILDEQNRLIVIPATDAGQPALKAEVLAMFAACSPCWVTQPRMTSESDKGSTCVRSTSA